MFGERDADGAIELFKEAAVVGLRGSWRFCSVASQEAEGQFPAGIRGLEDRLGF